MLKGIEPAVDMSQTKEGLQTNEFQMILNDKRIVADPKPGYKKSRDG